MATRSTRCPALPPKLAACATNHAATSTQTAVQRSRWPVAMLTFSEASARILFMQDDLLSAAGRGAVFRGLSVYTGNAHPKFARDIAAHLEVPLGDARSEE